MQLPHLTLSLTQSLFLFCFNISLIKGIIPFPESSKRIFILKNILKTEYNKYKDISARVNKLYNNFATNKEPHETNTMNKMMTWYGIQMKTMTDDTTSKLSELLMQGTNMGIIEGRRLINQNANVSSDVKNILHDFVTMQEDSVETLKKYL